jgi:hypothetical protein
MKDLPTAFLGARGLSRAGVSDGRTLILVSLLLNRGAVAELRTLSQHLREPATQ